jgi:hypothetical protein
MYRIKWRIITNPLHSNFCNKQHTNTARELHKNYRKRGWFRVCKTIARSFQKPNALAMLIDPTFKVVLLWEDEVKLPINVINREINEYIPDPQ